MQPGTLVGDIFKLCSSGTQKQVSQIQTSPRDRDLLTNPVTFGSRG
jgi:hypothetical protein